MWNEIIKQLLAILFKWIRLAVLIRIVWIIGMMWFVGINYVNELFWLLVMWVLLMFLYDAMKMFICRNPLAELLNLQSVFADNEPTLEQIDAYIDLARLEYININGNK